MARIITITSGKGGVGKTSISLNLSLALAEKGFKVCLFDADLGLANVNILTGIYPEKDMASVISGQFSLKEIMIKDFGGIDIIPGSSGIEQIADLTQTQTGTLISAFLDLDDYDFFIFDTSAGVSAQVLSFCMASHEIILVATCEPTSLTDAYSMLKVLSKYNYKNPVKVVINQVKSGKAAQKAYNRIKQTAGRFLSIPVEPLGIMAADKNVQAAVISQTPFFQLFPDTVATKCIQAITNRLLEKSKMVSDIPLELFWDKALRFLDTHYSGKKTSKKEQQRKEASTQVVVHSHDIDPELQRQLTVFDSKITAMANDITIIKQMLKQNKSPQRKILPKKNPKIQKVSRIKNQVQDQFSNRIPDKALDQKPDQKPGPAPKVSHKSVTLDFEAWYKKRKQS
ncbi:MAG: MinD/ParA family protein [Desulfobacula sp.]|nr:MinD/ParA family protein [Desulfobacula sp.]